MNFHNIALYNHTSGTVMLLVFVLVCVVLVAVIMSMINGSKKKEDE